ncbi:hypothetical protein F4810DRAFT_576182 [Camillea tinctor]|nr:hypothetical protein F4810DRAFT_576182 [Camillea tinctor]
MSFFQRLLLPLGLSLSLTAVDAAVIRQNSDLRSLLSDPARQWSDATTISYPGSSEFTGATERWTIFDPPTYTAAISPGTEEDVIKLVNLARSNDIPFLATGGRHGYTTTIGDLHDGLAIDLSNLNSYSIDSDAGTLTAGAGVRVNTIMDPVYEAGYFLQTGTAYCPGLIGVTLGGGIGRFTGLYGLMIDALVSVRIVTANGTLIEASESSNSDLFWGIRGAGANFGIITEATFQLNPVPNGGNIFTSDLIFPANMTNEFFQAVESYNNVFPAEMAGIVIMSWDDTSNSTVLLTNWIYVGSEDDARSALAPILNLSPPYLTTQMVTANKLINSTFNNFAAAICTEGVIRDIHSTNLKNHNATTWQSTFEQVADFFESHPGARSGAVQYELYPNQAMNAVSSDATAWPWRDAIGYFQTAFSWDQGDDATASASATFAQELMSEVVETSGYSDVTIFVNYANGDEKQENIYGADKLPRLAQLKRTYDPSEMFSWNNGIPTQYP